MKIIFVDPSCGPRDFSYHLGRVGHLYRREWGTLSIGAACMGRVAKTWPPCHGGGWDREIYEQGVVERVENVEGRSRVGVGLEGKKKEKNKINKGVLARNRGDLEQKKKWEMRGVKTFWRELEKWSWKLDSKGDLSGTTITSFLLQL